MSSANENFNAWLRDAHAMGHQAIESFEGQVRRLENYPEVRAWVQEHLQAAERHRELIKECIRRRGGDISAVKDLAMKVMGNIQHITGTIAGDEIMKNVITDYAFKYYQIANYKILAHTAAQLGDQETSRVIQQIHDKEKELVDRLEPMLTDMAMKYLRRDELELAAKR